MSASADETGLPFGRVERIHSDSGSHIEPPLDEGWDDLTKLQWCAAVTEADTGLRVRVAPGGAQQQRFGRWVSVPGSYSVMVGGSSISSFTFGSAWTFLSGVSVGAEQAGKS